MPGPLPLAVNYSPAARALRQAGEVAFDLWKCTPPGQFGGVENAVGTSLPAYVHFPLDAGEPDLLATDWDEVERTMDASATPHVNVHLNARREAFAGTAKADLDEAVRSRFLRALETMVARFGPERVVAENVVYRGEGGAFLRACVEPATIGDAIAATGCRFLLDLAHATLSAAALGADVRSYVAALPVHRLTELHVTGVGPDAGGRLRDSMPMTPDDWSLAEWALGKAMRGEWARPRMVALEYGGLGPLFEWRSEPSVLREELVRLKRLLDFPEEG